MCYVSRKHFDGGKASIAEFQHFLVESKLYVSVCIIHDCIPNSWHLAWTNSSLSINIR